MDGTKCQALLKVLNVNYQPPSPPTGSSYINSLTDILVTHCMDREVKAQRGKPICQKPQRWQVAALNFKPKFSITTQMVLPKEESKKASYITYTCSLICFLN